MLARLLLLNLVAVLLVAMIVSTPSGMAAPLVAEEIWFHDTFPQSNPRSQVSQHANMAFPDDFYSSAYSGPFVKLANLYDPLRYPGRLDTNYAVPWQMMNSGGDTTSWTAQTEGLRLYFRDQTDPDGPNSAGGLRFFPTGGNAPAFDSGVTMMLASCSGSRIKTQGWAISFMAQDGTQSAFSVTHACHGKVYYEMQRQGEGPVAVSELGPDVSFGGWIVGTLNFDLTTSTFVACANNNCKTFTPSNSGWRPATIQWVGLSNRTWHNGASVLSHWQDGWMRWATNGRITSSAITRPATGFGTFRAAFAHNSGAITFDILHGVTNSVLMSNVSTGANLTGVIAPSIKLRATLTRPSYHQTSPVLDWWQVTRISPTPTNTPTHTPTRTPTVTATSTPTQTSIPSRTPIFTSTHTPTRTPTSTPTQTPEPLMVDLQADYSALLYMAPELGQPTQILHGLVTGGIPPYSIAVQIEKPSGIRIAYVLTSSNSFVLNANNTSDPYFGVDEEGAWMARAKVADSQGWTAFSLPVTWYVSWYPVHGRP